MMSSQEPPSTGRRLSPIISRASVERDSLPNGSTSTSPPEPDQHHHIKPKNVSRAPRLSAGSSQSRSNDVAAQEEKTSTTAARTTEIPFRQDVVGTISGVISVDNPLDQRSGSNPQVTFCPSTISSDNAHPGSSSPPPVRVGFSGADLRPSLPTSPPRRPTTNPRRDSFIPTRPRHQESTFSNNASRWGRERLWGHHRPRRHDTEPNPVTGTEHDDQENRRLHYYEESDDGQRAYWRIIEQLQSPEHNGRTVKFDDFAKGLRAQYPHDREAGRAAVIEFFEGGRAEQTEFCTSRALRDYFNAPDPSTLTTQVPRGTRNSTQGIPLDFSTAPDPGSTTRPRRRIFILEDLPLNYVTVLGSRLHIHPDVFAGHYSCDQGWAFTHSLDFLPAGSHDKRRFKLRYSTLMPQTIIQRSKIKDVDKMGRSKNLNGKNKKEKKEKGQDKKGKANNEKQNDLEREESLPWLVQAGPEDWFNPKFNVVRGLETPTDNGNWDHRGKNAELEGQVSYWARTDAHKGWDVLLLVDPRFQEPHPPCWPVKRPTYESDYFHTDPKVDRTNRYPCLNDGCDLPSDLENWSLPSKHDIPSMNSLYHDILSHYQSKDNVLRHISKNPTDCTFIVRKFVTMKWISYLNHLHTCFWHCRGQLFGAPDEDDPEPKNSGIWAPTWTEWIYTRLQSWGSDLEIYRIDIASNMLNLGIDPNSTDSSGSSGRVSPEEAAQWRYIQSTLLQHKTMLKIVADNYVQVIGLRETRTSTTQAHQVGRLTILGTVFVPLSIISGILSMGGKYLPGEGKFWVYWVIAVPVLLVLTVSLLTGFWDWVGSWVDFAWKRRRRWEMVKKKQGALLPRFRRRSVVEVSEWSGKWAE